MTVIAPGKLILSGEHAVVHGFPALAMAVNRHASVTIRSQDSALIIFHLADLLCEKDINAAGLQQIKSHIRKRYQQFLQGELTVRDVIEEPVELLQFAMSIFLGETNQTIADGFKIHLQSTIPMGCGMGSSAAVILSLLYALKHHFDIDLSNEIIFRLALESESMQHGKSSGLDLQISFNGGCIYYHDQTLSMRSLPDLAMYLVNTGVPQSTTGECVAKTAPHFKNSNIGNDFAAVTNAMDAALATGQLSSVIRENHRLLMHIGAVPIKVQHFIHEIEKMGGAAKICGAGAVTGDNAGVVLVLIENKTALETLVENYHYSLLPIQGEPRGVHVV